MTCIKPCISRQGAECMMMRRLGHRKLKSTRVWYEMWFLNSLGATIHTLSIYYYNLCAGVCVCICISYGVCALRGSPTSSLLMRESSARDIIIYAATYLVSSDINKHDLSLASNATLAEAFVTDTLQIFVTQQCIASNWFLLSTLGWANRWQELNLKYIIEIDLRL